MGKRSRRSSFTYLWEFINHAAAGFCRKERKRKEEEEKEEEEEDTRQTPPTYQYGTKENGWKKKKERELFSLPSLARMKIGEKQQQQQ